MVEEDMVVEDMVTQVEEGEEVDMEDIPSLTPKEAEEVVVEVSLTDQRREDTKVTAVTRMVLTTRATTMPMLVIPRVVTILVTARTVTKLVTPRAGADRADILDQ